MYQHEHFSLVKVDSQLSSEEVPPILFLPDLVLHTAHTSFSSGTNAMGSGSTSDQQCTEGGFPKLFWLTEGMTLLPNSRAVCCDPRGAGDPCGISQHQTSQIAQSFLRTPCLVLSLMLQLPHHPPKKKSWHLLLQQKYYRTSFREKEMLILVIHRQCITSEFTLWVYKLNQALS